MKIRVFIICLLIVFCSPVVRAGGETVARCTVEDQVEVEVAVYNNNIGLVKDTRKVKLPAGEGELRFMGVASQIMPVTVHAKSLNYPDEFSIIEQNYEYDLMDENKLLDKYVGKKIKLVIWNEYQDRKYLVEATLLSNNNGQIYKIDDEIYIGHPGIKILPEIPEDLIAKPTLTWLYDNRSTEDHYLEVSYLSGGINWKADYVVVLNKEDTFANISGWITLDNKSGAAYKNARLKLIAGDVHRVAEEFKDKVFAMESRAAAPQFVEKPFFEYHIYDLQRKTTIKDNQTKQVSLLEAAGVNVQKEFLVYGTQMYYTRPYRDHDPKQAVSVYVKFMNIVDNKLGMPIPEGVMRLYKMDSEGSLQFIGEDRVSHTPADEEVRLKIGDAFDVVAERLQTDYKQITTGLHESEWKITLKNHKKEDITVGIIEPLFGNWTVIDSSHTYTKKDAFTIRFDVEVPKDNVVTVTYRLRVGL